MTTLDVITRLIDEATRLTGNEVADQAAVARGVALLDQLKKNQPYVIQHINTLLNALPEVVAVSLALFKPFDPKYQPQIVHYIRMLQSQLKGDKNE